MEDAAEPKRRFLTVEQVAEELNVGIPIVRALLKKSGELRGFQVGGRGIWRIGVADLEDFIRQAYRRTAEKLEAGDLREED